VGELVDQVPGAGWREDGCMPSHMLACGLGSALAELARTVAVHEIRGCQHEGCERNCRRRMIFEIAS
jgi:hypothetical protein